MATPSMTPTAAPARRLYRRRDDRMVAGVAAGLSDHLGIDALLLRIGFVITIVLGGLGVILYVAFWAVVPQRVDAGPRAAATSALNERLQLVGFAALGLIMLLIAQALGFGAGLLWPAAAALTGAALLWRQADETRRMRWRTLAGRGNPLIRSTSGPTAARYLGGVTLVIIGMITFLAAHGELQQARRAALPVVVVAAGVALVLGPWLLQSWRQLTEERDARVREQERVELAGRVHDSMLQTLTLIQRRADDPGEVRRLVRRSERELRGWLYVDAPSRESLHSVVAGICAEVEDSYRVTVDLVAVGDATAAGVQPIVQAIREATINAAKHSGVPTISVYLEVSAADVTAFVRDRGCGFDVDAVATDRYGVRESVVARMQRHGGSAVIRSSAAAGTEVRLRLPLRAPAATEAS